MKFVSDVMSKAPVVVPADLSAADAAVIMRDERVDAVVVVADGNPVGVLSAADLVFGTLAEGVDAADRSVSDLCSHVMFTAAPDQEVVEVQQFMLGLGVDRVVVLDASEPVGLVSLEMAAGAG